MQFIKSSDLKKYAVINTEQNKIIGFVKINSLNYRRYRNNFNEVTI